MNKIILFAAIVLLAACEKNEEPCVLKNVEVTTNSPVIVGWPIYIKTRSTQTETYKWIAPNGSTISPGGYDQSTFQILNAAYSDSGNYRLEITNTFGCFEYKGNSNVKIIAPPSAPCNVPNNTSTSNVIGLGDETYISVQYSYNTFNAYPLVASSNRSLHFKFFGNLPPKPGIYKTVYNTVSIENEGEVGCWISTFPLNEYVNKASQNVYVNKVNGKLQISFCNAQFTNPIGTASIVISAKITEP